MVIAANIVVAVGFLLVFRVFRANTFTSATIELVPKGSYHLNKEFPTKLTAAAPADVKLKKDTQTIADAVTYNEKLGKWSFEFKTSAAGDKAFTCKFKFAVCTDTTCEPKKEDLAWNVSVQ